MGAKWSSAKWTSRGQRHKLGAGRQRSDATTSKAIQALARQRLGGGGAVCEPVGSSVEIELLDRRLPLRFWAKVVVWQHEVLQGECWSWKFPLDSEGYGQIIRGSRSFYAHRFAWEALVGPLPDGIVLDHLCKNRACVRPAHIEPTMCRATFFRETEHVRFAERNVGVHPQARVDPRDEERRLSRARGSSASHEVQGELFESLCIGGDSRANEEEPARYGDRRLPKRFWNSVMRPETPVGCWERCGSQERSGYGHLAWEGKHWKAHRVSYTALVGPIPAGHDVHHVCKNPPCVRPDHLAAVTRREHLELDDNPIMRKLMKTRCIRGHDFTPVNTYRNSRGGRVCRRCNADYMRARRARDPEASRERERVYMRDYRRRKAEAAATGKHFVKKSRRRLGY